MEREILTQTSISAKDFDFIDRRSDDLNLPLAAYCNHDGNHTLAMSQHVFKYHIVPMFGMGYTLKAAPILRIPEEENLEVVIVKGKITLERRHSRSIS